MKKLFGSVLWISCLVLTQTVGAQPFGAGGPGGPPSSVDTAMMKLFGKTGGFRAKQAIKMLDEKGKESMSLTAKTAYLEGKTRTDIDFSEMKGKGMGPEMAAQMKQMGMDKIVSLLRPDLKKIYQIYPSMESALEMPIQKDQAEAIDKKVTVDKEVLGKETVGKYACTKNKVTITDEDGTKHEMLVWMAGELKDFPVKMEIAEKESKIIVEYSDISMTKPDAKEFEVPAGFAKYTNMQEFQMGIMQKMMRDK
jgi:hypothetical protein